MDWQAVPRAGVRLLAVSACVALLGGSLGFLVVRRAGMLLAAVDPLDVDLDRVLDQRAHSMPSVVLAADESEIGRFQPEERFKPVAFEDLPESVVTAVVATEDARFWQHSGVDLRAIVRALVRDVREGAPVEGGSTITQQLVKNLFTGSEKTVVRKLDEARLSAAVESRYSKQEILAAYLNTVYFGEGAVGIGAASHTYFRKPVGELSLSEAAVLAGLIRAPSALNPRAAPQAAEARRQHVLDRVDSIGAAAPETIAEARAARPVVHPARPSVARYPYFVDYVRRWLLDEWGLPPERLYGGGLRIRTSLVPPLQDAARAAVSRHLPDPAGPAAAVVVLDPGRGSVRALVGGRHWATSSVNLALGRDGGGSGRQPGSAFKPFVLAEAFEQGWSPADRIEAPREHVVGGLPVRNYDRRGHGDLRLDDALRKSVNTAFVKLTEEVGAGEVARLAQTLGLEGVPSPELVGPRIGIGRYEVSPLRMAAAYGAFANGGRAVLPRPVETIEGPDGVRLAKPLPPGTGAQTVERETAALVTSALRLVVERGTGTAARLDRPVAGKTGTTDDYTNAWFVGFTPQLAASVWIGHPDGAVPMRNVAGVDAVTGGSIPARLWSDVMHAAHLGLPVVDFPPAPPRPPSTTTTTTAPKPPTSTTTTTTTTTTTSTTTTTAPTTTTTTTTERPKPKPKPKPTTTTTTAPAPTTTTTLAPSPTTTTTTTTAQPPDDDPSGTATSAGATRT